MECTNWAHTVDVVPRTKHGLDLVFLFVVVCVAVV